jgi:amino acid adenylation domain-containing protein
LCVPQIIAQQAIRYPDHIALIDFSARFTYQELNSRANQIAHRLLSLGVNSDARVAICMRRSALNIAAALAVLKIGAAYVPLDPVYPEERIRFVVNDANVQLVLGDCDTARLLSDCIPRCVLLDRDATVISGYPTSNPSECPKTTQLAYIIYTSGSTGTPKGVEISHHSLLNLVCWHKRAFAVVTKDRATQLASFGFDAAVWEIWPYLSAGATIHVTPDLTRSSPEALRDWLVSNEITISFVPTPIAERLIATTWPQETKLRFLLTGADVLQHYPRPGLPFQLVNNYGPTEATVVATSTLVPPDPSPHGMPPIGRPIDNTQIYILDQNQRPVATGEVGELYIGGAGVARGYTNSPGLTASKFITDPFSGNGAGKLYRTGDLGFFLPDGQIAFAGRVDSLIKIRGYRIEANEIVTVLNSHPLVEASAVIARNDNAGSARLLAYLVSRNNTSPRVRELRALLCDRLPDYMMPAAFIRLDSMPLTPNGKVDREALPEPGDANTLLDDYVAPRTALEDKLAGIIANLLGLGRVGISDNFFFLGGHSLLGTQLIARVRDSFGVDLPLRSIFDSPTSAQLAREIERLILARVDSMSEEDVRQKLSESASAEGRRQA